MATVLRATQLELDAAVQALREGELVAFPTETVYGLGAHAAHPRALQRLFEVKGRPPSHPLIVHLDSARSLRRWAREVPVAAEKLAERFWPGPLTLVLPRAESVHALVTGGQDTIAVRVPAHPMAQQLLAAFGEGIAAPSANRFGRLSPTRAEHVREDLGASVRVLLDGGPCQLGVESTIVACLGDTVRLLRPGAIHGAQLRRVVGEVQSAGGADAPRAPGSHPAHYAPLTPLSLVPGERLDELVRALSQRGRRVAVLALRAPPAICERVTWIDAGPSPDGYAHELYAHLHTLDRAGCERILVQQVPAGERWEAVRDRLRRAAAGSAAGRDTGEETRSCGGAVLNG